MSNTPAPRDDVWVKSTYSDGQGGNCIEWAPSYAMTHGVVPIRDSKTPSAPALMLSPEAFTALVAFARSANV
ncbi:DUF397 domain-containing protein [Streptomyces sp. NBC_00252]|uniref:DUF397 domain-containing protein n=1 Tax=Streptomyces sp. NBC_00252 TaxID=2975691 RepID=UPI002E299AAB|nr:DUF397 domain-containing protein [Streptomyces sp. NBC_00252]